jgi:hypothetical protein
MFGIFSKSKKASSKKKKKKGSAKAKKPAEALLDENIEVPEIPFEQELSPPPSAPDSIASAQEKLDQAKANLEAGNFKNKLAPGDRQALIEQALAVHKVQSKLLDDLDPDIKQRLRTLAMEKVFKITPKN